MVKSAFARQQVKKRIKKYEKQLKGFHSYGMLEMLGFGRNFKKDPWDCGNPGCCLCHGQGRNKSNPKKVRKENLNYREMLEDV